MCYTGLSFSNVITLSDDCLLPIDDSRIKLDTQRVKTKETIIQILPKEAQKILEKYALNNKGILLPKVSLETVNLKLKILQAAANINITLSTKIARTTCNQLLNNVGFFDPVYKRLYLGWSNLKDISNVYTTIDDHVLLKNTIRVDTYLETFLK